MTAEEVVLRYFKNHRNSKLLFSIPHNYTGNSEITYTGDMDKLILDILDRASNFNSIYGTTKTIQTSRGRIRSSGDIWRHAISIDPSITIFEIMRSLYYMTMEKENTPGRTNILGAFCHVVKKRVFHTSWGMRGYYGLGQIDEYGLLFQDWKNIGLEV